MNDSTLQHGGVKFWQVAVGLAISIILAAAFLPVRGRGGWPDRRSLCKSNLKQIMLGVKQYIQDYDEKYSILATSKAEFGWAGALQPYLKSTQLLQCPSELTPLEKLPAQPGYTDYWFNAKLAGLKEERIEYQTQTVALGDGNSNNARYHLWKMSQSWQNDIKSPLHRHLDGANFAFADGHVKWFSAKRWNNGLDMTNGPTLRLKPTK